jgi:PST family polysaccharide transporter
MGPAAINFFVFLILLKFIGPAELGLIAIAQIWIGGIRILGSFGFSGALIQAENVSQRQLSSVFFLNIGGLTLVILLFLGQLWGLSLQEDNSELLQIMAFMSLTLIISAISLVPESLAYRDLRFSFLAKRDTLSSTIGGGIGIALAVYGWGVWALVAQTLAATIASSTILWCNANWLPKLSECRVSEVKPLLNVSCWLLAFQLISFLIKEIDKSIMGALLEIHVLGAYAFANKIIVLPIGILSDALNGYLFPYLSSIKGKEEKSKNFYGAVLILIMCAFPLIFLLGIIFYLYASPIFGPEWNSASQFIPYIAIIAACQTYISPAGSALKARGQVSVLFKWSIFMFFLLVIGTIAGSFFGLNGIMAGLVGSYIICAIAITVLISHIFGNTQGFQIFLYFLICQVFGLVLANFIINNILLISTYSLFINILIIFAASLIYFSFIYLLIRTRIYHFVELGKTN